MYGRRVYLDFDVMIFAKYVELSFMKIHPTSDGLQKSDAIGCDSDVIK